MLCLAAVSLLAAACSGGADEAAREPVPAPGDASLISSEAAPVSDFPAEVVNSWGVTTFQGYLDIDRRQTTDHPYGPLGGGSTTLLRSLDERVGESQAIVVGTVIDISPAYSNSVGGGFWYKPSTLTSGWILQDVTIEVERVLGDTAELTAVEGAPKESIVVTIWGGHIEVTFDESVDPALLREGFEPGRTYMVASASNVRVAEGDRVLVIINMQMSPWFGAPVDPEMPWGKTPATPCPTQPLGTKIVVFGSWHHLSAEDQQLTVQERTVTFDELEALAEAELGQSLEDPSAPRGPGNGSPSADDHPPPPCYTRHPPTQLSEPAHIHPGYED